MVNLLVGPYALAQKVGFLQCVAVSMNHVVRSSVIVSIWPTFTYHNGQSSGQSIYALAQKVGF